MQMGNQAIQSLEKKNADGEPATRNPENQTTPSHPPGYGPIPMHHAQGMIPLHAYPASSTLPMVHNSHDAHAMQWPLYGLPPGYTPPSAGTSLENNGQTTAAQNQMDPGPGAEAQQVQTSVPALVPYGLPPGHNSPQVANSNGNGIPVSNPENSVTVHGPNFNVQGNPQNVFTNPMMWPSSYTRPVMGEHMQYSSSGYPHGDIRWKALEERLRAVEGGNCYGLGNASDLCLVPNVVIPPKFQIPEFDKYKGATCPKSHLTMYCRKMASQTNDDKILIHFFQDSLAGAASNWYTHLEPARIRCWKDLADAFLKQYKYNIDMAPDRMQLQNMTKRDNESFKEYAQRWRGLAAQVEPPLIEKEMVAMFMDTLQSPFYDRMIGSVSSNFSDMVIIGERVEGGMRTGKIACSSSGPNFAKKPPISFAKKKDGETNAVMTNQGGTFQEKQSQFQQPPPIPYMPYPYIAAASQHPYPQPNQPRMPFHLPFPTQSQVPLGTLPQQTPRQNSNPPTDRQRPPNNQDRKPVQFDPIPMSYTDLFRHLQQNSLISPRSMKPLEPPFPRWYDPDAKCEFHAGAMGHTTESCRGLKYVVQDLINAKWLNFKKDGPNVGSNPLLGHENSSVIMIEGFWTFPLVTRVEDIHTPLKVIFAELCRFGVIKMTYDDNCLCGLHPNESHDIQECVEFRKVLQDLLDGHFVQVSSMGSSEDVLTLQSGSGSGVTFPRPLEIFYQEGIEPTLFTPKPLTIHVPSPFPFETSNAVPWNYDTKIFVGNSSGKQVEVTPGFNDPAITNISGTSGMTRSGRIYTPGELLKGKEKVVELPYQGAVEGKKSKNTAPEEETCEFLKLMRQSEYKVVDQLNHTPAKISLLSLLLNSELHRDALMKVLNSAHVTQDITVNQFDGIVGNIVANNYLTFIDDEMTVDGKKHNRALHISVKCMDYVIARVLVDTGSSLNVMPRSTLARLSVDGSYLKSSSMVVRAFDGSRREVIGEIELPVQIGPHTFEITFQVMDIMPAYSCLLGRPWIHAAGAVTSTLHQKLKFIVGDKMVIIFGEEENLVRRSPSARYIEAAEEALETSFQALEIANATLVNEETLADKPNSSKTEMMIAKVMMKGGYQVGRGLGKHEQGITAPLELSENTNKHGIGYWPTLNDGKRVAKKKWGKGVARLENKESSEGKVPICGIKQTFQSAGMLDPNQVAVVEGDGDTPVDLVRPCPPNEELRNWEIVEFPVIFNSK